MGSRKGPGRRCELFGPASPVSCTIRVNLPKTEAGKARASGNAFKHGLQSSTRLLLHDEDPKALAELRDALGDELRPSTALQQALCDLIVSKFWRLRRASGSQGNKLETEVGVDRWQVLPNFGPDGIHCRWNRQRGGERLDVR